MPNYDHGIVWPPSEPKTPEELDLFRRVKELEEEVRRLRREKEGRKIYEVSTTYKFIYDIEAKDEAEAKTIVSDKEQDLEEKDWEFLGMEIKELED